ncbi:hypothetical protein Anas_11760 [Armadillidium nasatum]|uniref:Uncharacterized protein n=1 Tax=Armadillidium nasatum TaxID=96803 RepID=A0A5N5SWW6_9CRUS|nr:hypothetical protein Anas_11760 [Armadillidium nasatum]
MSSKVIKWFKRQASIRRHSENKSEEKSSNEKSEEKRKSSFPRLSFRKRNKRKESDTGGGFSIAGISKKFSFSVPKEMESHTKENPIDSRVPTSQSTNFGGSVSLTNSPSKTGEFQSICSEGSYQSSFDNSKENAVNESFSVNGKEHFKTEQNKSRSESVSKSSNYDYQQSFNCISEGSKSNTSLNNFYENTKKENAPIVKMEEICDSYSDKEHPEETESNVGFDTSIPNSNSCKEECEKSVLDNVKNGINNQCLYDNLNLELVKLKCEETVLFIKEEMDSTSENSETKIQKEEKQLENVFEEIDRLVKDAASIAEFEAEEINSSENFSNDGEISAKSNVETEETEVSEELRQTNDSSNTETDENLGNSDTTDLIKDDGISREGKEFKNKGLHKISENIVDQNCRNSSEDISTLSTDDSSLSHLPANSLNGNDKITVEEPISSRESNNKIAQSLTEINGNEKVINKINETNSNFEKSEELEIGSNENLINEELENEIELKITEESDENQSKSTDLNHKLLSNLREESSFTDKDDEKSVTSPVQITFTHPSPVKKKEPNKLLESETITSTPNYYPKELNPFGDDDEEEKSDAFTEATNYVPANNDYNIEVSPKGKFQNGVKENGFSSSRRETPENNLVLRRKMRSSSSSPQLKSSYRDGSQQRREHYNKSLNPFGESDDDEDPSSLNYTNPFDEEGDDDDVRSNAPNSSWRETPPCLPPKSADLQTRKNSRGFLPPIPHPRRSKQSHHGSYTSLQNVSTSIPIPAPRSITPFGSTKTLNYPLNPFDDEDDDQVADFRRRGVGRSSLQALPVTSTSQEPLARTGVRGSLPPSKIKLNRKKRPAPLPPGFNQNKPSANLSDFSSLPRKRSSMSAFDVSRSERKYSFSSRDQSPQRMPPPRPPPPKYNY